MLSNCKVEKRLQGFQKILDIRAKNLEMENVPIRIYKPPDLKMTDKSFDDFWVSNVVKSEPPVLANIPLWKLHQKVIEGPIVFDYPCHSQSVERVVQLVSRTATKVHGAENRDGVIRTTLKSRAQMSLFKSKIDFRQ